MSGGRNFAFRKYSNIEHLLHPTRPEHSYTPFDKSKPKNIDTLHLNALRHLFQTSMDNLGQPKWQTDTNRRPNTSPDTQKAVWGCVMVHVEVEWRLLVSVGVCWCLIVSYVVCRVSEEFLKGYLSGVYGRVWCLGSYEGVSECSGHVGCRKCSILEYFRKVKLHPPDTFETLK